VLETWYYYRTIIFAKFRGESLFFWFLFKLNCPLNRKSGHLSGVIGERGGTGICSGKGNAGNLSSSVEYLPLKALKMSSGILISKKPILYNCIIRHYTVYEFHFPLYPVIQLGNFCWLRRGKVRKYVFKF